MRRDAGAHYTPQYLADLTETHSPRFSSSSSYARTRSPNRKIEPKRIPVVCAASPVGGMRKRSFDITAACVGLVLLIPLLFLIAMAVKFADRGPIFYRHWRIGRNGVPFP